MQDVFTVVGLVCALLVCGGVFLFAAAVFVRVRENSDYAGLRDQISNAAANIDEHYRANEPMSALAVRRILITLNNRHYPDIGSIKCHDVRVLDRVGNEGRA